MPPVLDLRDADPKALIPQNALNEAEIKAVRQAWAPVIRPYSGATAIRVRLPNDDGRAALILAANQALKAQNPLIEIYLAYDENAPSNWDESFWGGLDGGVIAPDDLPGKLENWMAVLVKAQEQLPARPWTIWCPGDPGAQAAQLLGGGARLVVPPGGPTAALADSIPVGLDEAHGGNGVLSVGDRSGQRVLHWEFKGSEWKPFVPEKEHEIVVVEDRADYDVHALLARVRATQLRDISALITQESQLNINIHAQSSRGMGADLGYKFASFEMAGEPEEFLQEELLFNGVKAKIQGELQLPIIESKRSVSPPVALNLTERYRYSDGGPGAVGQRWIRFAPVSDAPTLFTGQILVDEAAGRILEERSERANLPGIVKSERRRLIYGEPAPGFWRVMNIQTFERWVLAGGVTQVQRDLVYQNFKINQGGFLQNRQKARDSKGAMLRQTEDGMRYLTRGKDGVRYVEQKQRSSGRAIGGGIMIDPSLQYPVIPMAALVLFDYDAFGKGIQYSAMLAGLFNMATLNIPHLPGGFDLGLNVSGGFLASTERPVENGELQDKDGVARQSGQMRISLGRDLGAGFRLRLQGLGIYNRFSDSKEEDYRTPGYIIPPSGFTLGFTGELSWLYRGFQLRGNYGAGSRPDGQFGPPNDIRPIADGGKYKLWGATAAYDLRLKSTARIHGETGMDGGSGFDRFLSLDIGGMGGSVRVSGIRSNAVVSDRIQYASLGYAFPASPLFRVSCRLDHARARNLDDQKFYGFTGLGVSGDIPGFWWFTTIRVDIGVGLHSDIPGVRSVNGYIALLRVF
ncbi:MAG: hypothetical protein LBQ86_06150 [Holophagales bacterium]|nr:hypothetical protein [Holophagales bacterium]